jgi:phosphoribosylanthranilate isomerase
MKIKICGMKEAQNIQEVAKLNPDLMGFIFYEKSARYVDAKILADAVQTLPSSISKVGVFVDEELEKVLDLCNSFGLKYAQLHGKETPEYCEKIKAGGISVIKVFHMDKTFDLSQVEAYENYSEVFLFDTKTKGYGGSGKHFDWSLLNQYTLDTPFLLSGGISTEDLTTIKALNIPKLMGIDVNSRVEISPGNKDVNKVKELILKTREG